ncbi:hypothetical protein [Heyndrickxia faecalis]
MRDLSITDVKTTNRIGAKETVVIPGEYGSNTMEVPKAEVGLEDLFSGSNAYAKKMKEEYDNWKLQNPDQEISEKDYEQAVLHSRAFQYDSIRDGQEKKEFWGQIASLAVIVGTSIICPPAGLALGIAYGTLELESAATGKDWISGRELGTGERVFRGVLAPLDIVPGVSGLSKFSSTVRLAHMGEVTELGLKTGLKAGIQRESRHVANMVIDAGKDSAARIRSAKAWAKEVPRKVKQKVADDIIDTARLMDSTNIYVKNVIPSRKLGLVIEGPRNVRLFTENKHMLENGVRKLFNRRNDVNLRYIKIARNTEKIKEFGKYSTAIDDKVKVIEKADLPSWIGKSFKDGNYRTVITEKNVILFRTYGGDAKMTGAFATTRPAGNRINAKIDAALVPDWKNSRQYEAVIEVPKGKILNIGRVEKQFTKTGALLKGDGDQILLPQGWPSEWIKEVREVPSR